MKRVHRSKGMVAVLCGALSLSLLAPACGDDDGGTDDVGGGAAGGAGAGAKAGTGGAKGGSGGRNGEGGEPVGGTANGGTGGTTAGTGGTTPGTAGANEGGMGGTSEGGSGGVSEGGVGGVGEGGTGGVAEGGMGGVPAEGEGGAGGSDGGGPVFTNCLDGCASLYAPFTDDAEQQYFQITFDGGADLSGSIVSFKIRARDYTGTGGYVNTTAHDGTNFFGSPGGNAKGLTAISDWTVITLDLAAAAEPFDATIVNNISLQIGGTAVPVRLEVDEVTFSDGALDPILFETDGSPFEASQYNPVPGSIVEWQGPY